MQDQSIKRDKYRFAIADGATEASFSGIWAQLLVIGYCRGHLLSADTHFLLDRYQKRWKNLIAKKSLPWFAEQKVEAGAYASLLGITIEPPQPSERGLWHAFAVGDSCLVHVRGSETLNKFPLTHSDEFNSRPVLICSIQTANQAVFGASKTLTASWEVGDIFYLMTDAIAAWFMRQDELGRRPWLELDELSNQDQFRAWVTKRREAKELKNDDVTLTTIRMFP